MQRILLSIPDGADHAARGRADTLAATLRRVGITFETEVVNCPVEQPLRLLSRAPDAVVAVGYEAVDIAACRCLKCPVLWDMAHLEKADVSGLLGTPEGARVLRQALATATSHVDVSEAVAFEIEDQLAVGLSTHDILTALKVAFRRAVVVVGAGLGNMIYATPMLRWLSERVDAPVDLVIHERFDVAVPLFARAPWLNAVLPGFEYRTGQHYRLAVSSVTAGALRPGFTADRMLFVDERRDYNVEGRFMHETRLNFVDLEQIFDDVPSLAEEIPPPFIRDFAYSHPGNRVVGVAGGKKDGTWANREWPHMAELVERLAAQGWELRSFGLPDEYLPGAEDFTGLPMRMALERMAECSFFISYDGGICHMAEAIGVPTIWLFGPSSLVKNGPYFAHSPALLSRRACGPCIYRIDWARCQTADCMKDITLDEVVAHLEELRAGIESLGYAPAPAEEDAELLAYEAGSLRRPGPVELQERNLRERFVLTGEAPAGLEHLGVSLLAVGDIAGAADMADALRRRAPENRTGRLLSALVGLAAPGPSPVPGWEDRPERIDPALLSRLGDVLDRRGLSPAQRRCLVLSVARLLVRDMDAEGARACLEAAWLHPGLAEEFGPLLARLAYLVGAMGGNCGADPVPGLFRDGSRLHMDAVRETPVSTQLDRYAAHLSGPLGVEPAVARETALTPHRHDLLSVMRERPRVPLRIGTEDPGLRLHDTVLAVVPHVKVKHARPGSSSNLILLQMTRLATLGLRPVVVTVGHEDIRQGWEMRDSVTYIQGHRDWSAEAWEHVVESFDPTLTLCYGGIEDGLDLPAKLVARLRRVGLDGLFDQAGLLSDRDAAEQWAAAPSPAEEGGAVTDGLSASLFVSPDIPRPRVPQRPLRAIVLLPDSQDMPSFLTVATAVPAIDFLVATPLRHRGVEKNIRTILPDALAQSDWNAAHLVVQFSSRRAVLAAESIVWMERGGALVAACRLESSDIGSAALHSVARPDNPADWIRALRGAATRLGRASLCLVGSGP